MVFVYVFSQSSEEEEEEVSEYETEEDDTFEPIPANQRAVLEKNSLSYYR
jgi:hypothetical protein